MGEELDVVGAESFTRVVCDNPVMPAECVVPLEPLRWALKAALMAASEDDQTRYMLCGVFVERVGEPDGCPVGTLRFTATDGHRMHVCEVYAPRDGMAPDPFAVPRTLERAGLERLAKALPKGRALKVLTETGVNVTLDVGGVLRARVPGVPDPVTLASVDGRFPDYRQVLPKERVSDDGNTGPLVQGFDPAYVGEAMSAAPGRSVRWHLPPDELSPCLFTSHCPDLGTLRAVVMPMRI